MNILVTGGAGYVGSIVTEELLKQGYRAIVLDNLQQGHREAIPSGAELIVADICQSKSLDTVFNQTKIDAVMHMAAETVVEYSMTDPKRYFRNNIVGGMNLLDTMLQYGVLKFIFSSSAAVYGEPDETPISENQPKVPVNSYGESKLIFEHILYWYGRAYGLKYISLRYFNAAGASGQLGEDHHPESHLIPNLLKAASYGKSPVPIFGTDYPTKDGTCIRDYINVIDIAKAHVLALEKLDTLSSRVYNLGNGSGYSVFEVLDAAKRVTDTNIPTEILQARKGDPAVLVASSARAEAELGWKPQCPELEDTIESAWRWIKTHPNGYEQ